MTKGQYPAARGLVSSLALAVVALMLLACGEEAAPQYGGTNSSDVAGVDTGSMTVPALSDAARAGEDVFNTRCSVCHGVNAAGTGQGPPLVHSIYEPGHHPDFSIRNAVNQGVPEHHWVFGDMAPVPGVSDDQVEEIICYVRELQRANGIFEGDALSPFC